MSVYYLWKGEYGKNELLLERAEAEICHRTPSPFTVIRINMMRGIHYWITARYDEALGTLTAGLEISRQSGIHLYDSLLWSFRAAAEMAPGNLRQAGVSIKEQMASLLLVTNNLGTYFLHVNSAWHALLSGDPSRAAEHLDTIADVTERMGTPYYLALWRIGMAQTCSLLGDGEAAADHVRKALSIGRAMKSHVIEWYALLVKAWLHLRNGEDAKGLSVLQRGLSLGRVHGYIHLEFYLPEVVHFLFVVALQEEIETDYVRGQIRTLKLSPAHAHEGAALACFLEKWPYAIKIRTLGRFEVLKDDSPLSFSGKEQKKPLALLKTLLACGGLDVPRERLTDFLWPDADGDLAIKSFEMTLGRLRKLLGRDEALIYKARHLSLNPCHCWADSLALEQLLDVIRGAPEEQAALLCLKAMALYEGPFLPTDATLTWAANCRETLKRGIVRAVLMAGRHHEKGESWEPAVDCYRVGIGIDPLAEEMYRRMMICQQRLGNHAEVVRIFQSCRAVLHDELGVDPSPDTIAIHNAVVHTR